MKLIKRRQTAVSSVSLHFSGDAPRYVHVKKVRDSRCI